MSAIGPSLPPHLVQKRKRSGSESSEQEEARPAAAKRSRSSSPKSTAGPRVIGPTLPPARGDVESPYGLSGPSPRAMGPTLPPETAAAIDRSTTPPVDQDEESSDDDYGPALPPSHDAAAPRLENARTSHGPALPIQAEPAGPQREEWMLAPPSGTDWTSRIDTTKIKNRKFNTGRGAKGAATGAGSGGVSGLWTETPEEKRKRLANEVLGTTEGQASGISKEEAARAEVARRRKEEQDRETRRRVREYDEAHRGSASLVEALGQKKKKEGTKDDDPSKRAFDYERDIAGGVMSGSEQRNIMNQAKSMGGKFDKGRFL